MKFASLLISFYLAALCCFGQPLQRIAHCPSNEVYDMLIDKKGFIWIAHNLGISRYDGISFTSFTNPEETSISMTDLVEDNYGRIWCHNFNGQIFYIKDDKMVYLKEYDFKKETVFPRMMLYKDELIITSSVGMFVCNTSSLKSKYIFFPGHGITPHIGSFNLCVVNGEVLMQDAYYYWYIYKGNGRLVDLPSKNLYFKPLTPHVLKLEPRVFSDTAFLMDVSEGNLYGLTILNDTLVTVFKKRLNSVINTIKVLNGQVWVNTAEKTFLLFGTDTIRNYSITSVLSDKEGNIWYTSLIYGILVKYKLTGWEKIQLQFAWGQDFVRCIKKIANGFLVGSQFGKVMIVDFFANTSVGTPFIMSSKYGNPINIQHAYGNIYFIEASKSLLAIDAKKDEVRIIDSVVSSKDIALNGNMAYLAASWAVVTKDIRDWGLSNPFVQSNSFGIADSLLIINPSMEIMRIKALKNMHRCRAVMFDSGTNSLLASFTDGLQRVENSHISFVLYNGRPLYVSSMARYGNKIYAGTFNNGLFAIEGYSVKKIDNNTEAPQDAIVRIKCCKSHIWVFKADDIEVVDAKTDKPADIYPFPTDVTNITDVEEDSNNIYLTTYEGIYTIPTKAKATFVKANPSLLYMLVNNTDTVFQPGISLPASKNNLLFRLAIPVYKNAEKLHFKYRLLNDNDTTGNIWYYTQDAQRDIQFNALKPGTYAIEISAAKDNRIISTMPLVYSFTIEKPWYNTWWFYVVVLLFTVFASVALYQYRLYQLVKMERMRRKISHDLHDDIGSTLSSINIYSQLAKGSYGNEGYIDTIQDNTVGIINSLDDLVWNINPKNDTLGQLVSRMELFATPLLQQKDIACIFRVKLWEQSVVIQPDVRANIYLLFKEIINNVVKHAACTQCVVYLIQKGNKLRLVVNDNGKGFNVKAPSQHRNGLHTMAERVKQLKGTIQIKSSPGEGTEIQIDCYVK